MHYALIAKPGAAYMLGGLPVATARTKAEILRAQLKLGLRAQTYVKEIRR